MCNSSSCTTVFLHGACKPSEPLSRWNDKKWQNLYFLALEWNGEPWIYGKAEVLIENSSYVNPGHPWTGECIETTLKKINPTCWQGLQTSWIVGGRGWMLCFVCCDSSLLCAQWPMETARENRLTKKKRCAIQAHSNQPVKQTSWAEHGLVAF